MRAGRNLWGSRGFDTQSAVNDCPLSISRSFIATRPIGDGGADPVETVIER